MKRIICLFLFFLFLPLALSVYLPKPRNEKVGGIIGKIELKVMNHWRANAGTVFKAGVYNELTVVLRSKRNGKNIRVKTDKNGFFSVLNLESGHYELVACNLENYFYDGYIWDIPVNLEAVRNNSFIENYCFIFVSEKIITALNPIIVNLTFQQSYSNYSGGSITVQWARDCDEVITYFKEIDKGNKWVSFEVIKQVMLTSDSENMKKF